jgi:uncharacterized protein
MTAAALVALQQHDTHLTQLAHRRTKSPEHAVVADLEQRRVAIVAERARGVAEVESIDTERTGLESELAHVDERIATIDRQLKTADAKTADALNHERASQHTRSDALSDQILANLERAEPAEAAVAALDDQLGALDGELGTARAALAAVVGAVEAEAAAEQTARNEVAASLGDAVLARYERLRARLGGVAVAKLEGNRCTGCHIELASSAVQELRCAPADELTECPDCGRILIR